MKSRVCICVLYYILSVQSVLSFSQVKSGDFLITTKSDPGGDDGFPFSRRSFGLTVLSPSGSIRSSIKFPSYGRRNFVLGRTSISEDGEYAFTAAFRLLKLPIQFDDVTGDYEPLVHVTRLMKGEPEVIQTLTLPRCEHTFFDISIAAGAPLSNGDYEVYIGRKCYKEGCVGVISEVLKFRYRPSSGRWVLQLQMQLQLPPESVSTIGNKTCRGYSLNDGSELEKLRVLDGQLYGINATNAGVSGKYKLELVRVGDPRPLAEVSSKMVDGCDDESFHIDTAASFYGICYQSDLNPPESNPYQRRVDLVTVRQSVTTKAARPKGLELEFAASEPRSRYLYAIGTMKNGEVNQTHKVYRYNKRRIDRNPKPIFSLDPSLFFVPKQVDKSNEPITFEREQVEIAQVFIIPSLRHDD